MTGEKMNAAQLGQAATEYAAMIPQADPETSRAGKRQLWELVHRVGNPETASEAQAVTGALLGLLASDPPACVKREVLWSLSELGGDNVVAAVAAQLQDAEVRGDACMVLERLPGDKSLAALKAAQQVVPADFVMTVVQSLRARGMVVDDHPCEKLTPRKETQVKSSS